MAYDTPLEGSGVFEKPAHLVLDPEPHHWAGYVFTILSPLSLARLEQPFNCRVDGPIRTFHNIFPRPRDFPPNTSFPLPGSFGAISRPTRDLMSLNFVIRDLLDIVVVGIGHDYGESAKFPLLEELIDVKAP